MKKIPREARHTFKALIAFMESSGTPTKSMEEFAGRYAIDLTYMRRELQSERKGMFLTRLKVQGLID